MASNRSLGFLFGLLGAILVVLEGLLDLVRSAFFIAVGHPFIAFDEFTRSVLFVILGIVLLLFAVIGRDRGKDRALAAGVVMIVLALLGIFLLGFANGVLGLLGAIFVLIGGLLFVVDTR